MGFVALVALKVRHGSAGRDSVTLQTPVFRDHGECLFCKGMALQAGKRLHAYAVNALVLMTALTGIFIRLELVEASAMAYLALNVVHEHVFCMAVRFPERYRTLRYLA